MSFSRPALTHHKDSLSSLESEAPTISSQPSSTPFAARRAWRNTTGNISRAMNRSSMMVFADFNSFDESPGNSRQAGRESQHSGFSSYFSEPDFGPDFDPDIKSAAVSVSEKRQSVEEILKPDPPYHIFTLAKKKQMVYIVSLAGLFSPLSSNIYFPALGQISRELKVSLSLVSLTITVYMVVQGLAPSFWGPMSDTKGRRITFIGTFAVYLLACVGLAFSKDFTSLMIFRAVQAAGSAATISVGAGVIGDITTAKERGGLIGVFGGIRMMGQSIGPVFGGIITQYLGFRAIFWFLFGLGSLTLLLVLIFLPETLRSIAGNGTTQLHGIHRPLLYNFAPSPEALTDRDLPPKKNITFTSIVAPLKFLFEKDVFITLFFGAVVYTVWSMVTSSTTALFQEPFALTDLQVGLIFLPNGAGCVAGSYLTGYLMDHDYKIVEAKYRMDKNIAPTVELKKKDLLDFPVEESRLRNIWWIILIFVVSTALYGFSLQLKNLAPPLILQFFIAYAATAVFSLNSALVIDLFPGASASATAVNNLMRCSVGAAGVAGAQPLIDALGAGTSFLVLSALVGVLSPMLVAEWFWGAEWREARRLRLARREERDLEKSKFGGKA